MNGRFAHGRLMVAIGAMCVLALAGCSKSDGAPAASPTDIPAAQSSVTVNDIDQAAADAYREALNKSYDATKATGLTELWSDDGTAITTVLAWDPKAAKGVQDDIINADVEAIDLESMLPQANLDELDGLVSNSGFDIGSVKSPKDGVFVITVAIDESTMVTTYTVDAQGRIGTAVATIDNEPAGSATFVYGVSPEAVAAFKKLG